MNRTSNTTKMATNVSRVLFMICSMLLLMQSSTAQESFTSSSSAPSVQGDGEADATGKSSSSQSAIHRLRLACTHARGSFEDLFQISNMEDVYMDFRRDYESSETTVFLQNKANTNLQGSLCQMNVTCCTSAMEKTAELLAQNEFRFFYENIFRYHSESCQTPGKRLFKSAIQVMGEVVRNLEVKANQSLEGTLPIGTFDDLGRYLISFSGVADICPLPHLLTTQMQILIELKLKQLFKDDTDFGIMLKDSVSLQCMKNVSATMVQNIFKELQESLQRQLHDFGLFVQSTKLARNMLNVIRHHHLSESCITAITRMQYCSLCGAYGRFSPCRYMCINTLRGCFADLAELHVHFHRFTSFLRSLSTSLIAELKPDIFINANLRHLISIVDHLQEREGALREQILTECGTDDYDTDTSDEETETRKRRSIFQPIQESMNSKRTDPILDQLNFKEMSTVMEAELTCLERFEGKLVQVPEEICILGDMKIAHSTNTKCWTGSNLGTYEYPKVGLLKKDQVNNPVYSDLPMDTDILYAALIHDMNSMSSAINATMIFKERCLQSDDEDCSNTPVQQCIEGEPDGSGSAMGSGSGSGDSGSGRGRETTSFEDYEKPTFVDNQELGDVIDHGLNNALPDELTQNSTTTTPTTEDSFTLGTIIINGNNNDHEEMNNDNEDPTENIINSFDNRIRGPTITRVTAQPKPSTQESPVTSSASTTQDLPDIGSDRTTTSDGPTSTSYDRSSKTTPTTETASSQATSSSGDVTETKHPIIDDKVQIHDKDKAVEQTDEEKKMLHIFSSVASLHTMQVMYILLSLCMTTFTILFY